MSSALSRTLALAFASVALASRLLAVDGVILIDQSRALTGNVTPGDTPGFPITITQPGSYRLSGNLTVPNANTSGILLQASHVTVDLNGFAILGAVDCSSFPCVGAPVVPPSGPLPNFGSGVDSLTTTPLFNVTVRNGTIQGMGGHGITLYGDSHVVEHVHIRSNNGHGIQITPSADNGNSIVRHCTAQRNGSGIYIGRGLIVHNTVDVNKVYGVLIDTGNIMHNVISRNGFAGLSGHSNSRAAYLGNVFDGNLHNIVAGVNMGQNICDGAICP